MLYNESTFVNINKFLNKSLGDEISG